MCVCLQITGLEKHIIVVTIISSTVKAVNNLKILHIVGILNSKIPSSYNFFTMTDSFFHKCQ